MNSLWHALSNTMSDAVAFIGALGFGFAVFVVIAFVGSAIMRRIERT